MILILVGAAILLSATWTIDLLTKACCSWRSDGSHGRGTPKAGAPGAAALRDLRLRGSDILYWWLWPSGAIRRELARRALGGMPPPRARKDPTLEWPAPRPLDRGQRHIGADQDLDPVLPQGCRSCLSSPERPTPIRSNHDHQRSAQASPGERLRFTLQPPFKRPARQALHQCGANCFNRYCRRCRVR